MHRENGLAYTDSTLKHWLCVTLGEEGHSEYINHRSLIFLKICGFAEIDQITLLKNMVLSNLILIIQSIKGILILISQRMNTNGLCIFYNFSLTQAFTLCL